MTTELAYIVHGEGTAHRSSIAHHHRLDPITDTCLAVSYNADHDTQVHLPPTRSERIGGHVR